MNTESNSSKAHNLSSHQPAHDISLIENTSFDWKTVFGTMADNEDAQATLTACLGQLFPDKDKTALLKTVADLLLPDISAGLEGNILEIINKIFPPLFKKRFRVSFAEEIANVAPGDFKDEISTGDYKKPLRALVQEEMKEYSKIHNTDINSKLLEVGYQVFYDIDGDICIARVLTEKDLVETKATATIKTPCSDAKKSGKTAGANAGSTPSTAIAAKEIAGTTNADAASDVTVGASVDTDRTRKSSRGKSSCVVTPSNLPKKKPPVPDGKKRGGASSVKQQQLAKKPKVFQGYDDPFDEKPSSVQGNQDDHDNQDDHSEIIQAIWRDYEQQITKHVENLTVDNRKGRCFILQQVAGHVNKRARHNYTDEL
jgi:hypothetical protein